MPIYFLQVNLKDLELNVSTRMLLRDLIPRVQKARILVFIQTQLRDLNIIIFFFFLLCPAVLRRSHAYHSISK